MEFQQLYLYTFSHQFGTAHSLNYQSLATNKRVLEFTEAEVDCAGALNTW